MTTAKRLAGALTLAALLAACGSPPRQNYFTLAGPGAPPPAGTADSPSVFVGPVTVPEAVDRTAMVLRTGPNSVDVDDNNRWAEPLKSAIPRVIGETLMRELGTPRVMASRAANPAAADYRVAIEIQRFESSTAEGAAIDALWTVTPPKGAAARSGRSFVQEPARTPDLQGVAAAHSRALERIATEIAAAIKR